MNTEAFSQIVGLSLITFAVVVAMITTVAAARRETTPVFKGITKVVALWTVLGGIGLIVYVWVNYLPSGSGM